MENTTDLLILDGDCAESDLIPAIERVRAQSGHLTILLVATIPPFPLYSMAATPYGGVSVPENWQIEWKSTCEALDEKATEVRNVLQHQDVSGDVKTACCEAAMMDEVVARHAMVCDQAYISNRLRENEVIFQNLVYGLLFKSPVGVVLNAPEAPEFVQPKKAFVAWNTGLPAARAIHQALPILRAADEVTLAVFDPVMTEYQDGENPGSDVAQWLSHHDCNVTVQQYPSGGIEIGKAILSRAKDLGADLIVMGAYGRSRLRQNIMGGTSSTLIEQTKVPVLMAH